MDLISWQPKALKQIRKLPDKVGQSIRNAVNIELSDLSCARNVKPLLNHACAYRLRVGQYRVLFNIIGGQPLIVLIEEVKKRDERSY